MLNQLPKLKVLPKFLPAEHIIRFELAEGIPIFKASSIVQKRIEELLFKQKESELSQEEDDELCLYEELDDYLSLTNRLIRNMITDSQLQYDAA